MTKIQIEGILRDAGKYLIAYAIGRGWVDEVTGGLILSTIVAGGLSFWSYYTNKTTSMISEIVKSDKVKEVVVATPAIAEAQTSPKVVAQ